METNNVKDYVILNNGVKMPILAFGTYLIPNEDTTQAVLDALDAAIATLIRLAYMATKTKWVKP